MLTTDLLKAGVTLESLQRDLGIVANHHSTLPLVILNYHQCDSPRKSLIVQECRGLTLETDTWNVVARGMDRFFRPSQESEAFAKLRWEYATVQEKLDGSLILLYHYRGEWRVNTRGSFGDGLVGESGMTWTEMFWSCCGIDKSKLVAGSTYCFELCTRHNQVVRLYHEPRAVLIAVRHLNSYDVATDAIQEVARQIGAECVESYPLRTFDQVMDAIQHLQRYDPTFEGFVVRCSDERFKLKSLSYDAIHRMWDNGNAMCPKNLVRVAMLGCSDEAVKVYPSLKDALDKTKTVLDEEFNRLLTLHRQTATMESQKDFAMAVKNSPHSGILFAVRQKCGKQVNRDELLAAWSSQSERITKHLVDKGVL
jgi:hypothetical protein